jgi:hypothetical protein
VTRSGVRGLILPRDRLEVLCPVCREGCRICYPGEEERDEDQEAPWQMLRVHDREGPMEGHSSARQR